MRFLHPVLIVAALIGAATMPWQADAMSIQTPDGKTVTPAPQPGVDTSGTPFAPTPAAPDGSAGRKRKKAPEKKTERPFIDGYRLAYGMIYDQQNYADAIVLLHSLGHDEHPDVANLIGYASRKLGRTDDAKVWYEKALAADPQHARTWQYYGMWQLERGDRARAETYLERIRLICGNCEEYTSLRDALDGNIVY